MSYEALARKYRPRTFDELVGQKPIVRTLTNAIKSGRIHHAYVFSGVRGVGKTTMARVLAKALNCETGPTVAPCLACAPCQEIAAGNNLDVLEMDAASRTGVDDVRDLIDTTRYAPARDRYKVFIIDEFHMLSKPAFNALLKTLEEPPSRVVFIMATTELQKVPATVLSRTLQFDFRKVTTGEIVELLGRIAVQEKVTASRACIELIARAADGSVRDAESLLDQAIASCGATLDEGELRALLGLVPDETVEAFLSAVVAKDAAELLRIIEAALAEGHDLRVFLGGLIEGTRRLLILRTVERPRDILGLLPDHEERLAAIAARYEPLQLLRVFSILADLEGPLRYSEQPRYVLEAAAIRLASITDLAPIEDLIARLEQGPSAGPPGDLPPGGASGQPPSRDTPGPGSSRSGSGPGRPARGSGRAPSGTARPDAAQSPRPSGRRSPRGSSGLDGETAGTRGALPGSEANPAGSREDRSDPEGPPSDRLEGSAEPGADQAIASAGPRGAPPGFLDAMHATRPSLAALVEQAASIEIGADRMSILFRGTNAFARKSLEIPANMALVQEVARACLGREVAVEVRREGDPPPAGGSDPAMVGAAAAPEGGARLGEEPEPGTPERGTGGAARTPASGRDTPGASGRDALFAAALESPTVRKLIEKFDGRLVDVKEAP